MFTTLLLNFHTGHKYHKSHTLCALSNTFVTLTLTFDLEAAYNFSDPLTLLLKWSFLWIRRSAEGLRCKHKGREGPEGSEMEADETWNVVFVWKYLNPAATFLNINTLAECRKVSVNTAMLSANNIIHNSSLYSKTMQTVRKLQAASLIS